MVKISARVNPEGVAKGEALEVFWQLPVRRHLGSVDEEWDDSDVSGECLIDLEPNKIGRIINTARTIWCHS
jgi:hypothetical protein